MRISHLSDIQCMTLIEVRTFLNSLDALVVVEYCQIHMQLVFF
jgi:hypothetical protein